MRSLLIAKVSIDRAMQRGVLRPDEPWVSGCCKQRAAAQPSAEKPVVERNGSGELSPRLRYQRVGVLLGVGVALLLHRQETELSQLIP